MGNYISRKIPNPSHKNSNQTTVIFPSGEVRRIHQPTTTKVAELMMEAPQFFIVTIKSLKIGKRFHPLKADDNLEKGNVYAMFPMQRKNSIVTAGDMAALFITVKGTSKGRALRVLPEPPANEGSEAVMKLPRLSLEGIEVSSPLFSYRMSISRSKKPLLDTINEEQACSR